MEEEVYVVIRMVGSKIDVVSLSTTCRDAMEKILNNATEFITFHYPMFPKIELKNDQIQFVENQLDVNKFQIVTFFPKPNIKIIFKEVIAGFNQDHFIRSDIVEYNIVPFTQKQK